MTTKKLIALIIIGSLSTSSYAAVNYQSHADIYQAVTDYINATLDTDSDYEISIAQLDNRLKLPKCPSRLQAFTPSTSSLQAGRLSIGVRCQNPGWSIFTSVTLKIYANVVVLTQPIRRGQILTRHHLTTVKRDTAKLRNGYFKRIDLVENKQAKRNLAAGTALNRGLVTEPTLIKRGERIIISASAPNFDIRMQGLALMDGIKGQAIRVKNVSSGRTIAAKVVKAGLVSVVY